MAGARPRNATPPLDGIKVVDLSRYLPGPLAAQILGSLGARVLKVEEPGLGDPVRLAPPVSGGTGSLAAMLLAGVESLALDLKKPAACKALDRLLTEADVLLETFRPGGLAKLGLAPERLRARFPRLVICSLSGWGASGPYAPRAGHDLTYQAVGGMLAPTLGMPAVPAADLLGAWAAATAVLAALNRRGASGKGAWIDASLFDAALHGNLLGWAAEAGGPRPAGEPLMLSGALACYNLYPTSDGGLLALAALEPHFWKRFCAAVGRPDLVPLHLSREESARLKVAEVVAARGRRAWRELAAAHDLPAEVVRSAEEALEHPQTTERGVVAHGADGLPRIAFPARFDGRRPGSAEAFPALGEHTGAVLEEHGHPGVPFLRRRAGIGKRFSLRRFLLRFALRSKTT